MSCILMLKGSDAFHQVHGFLKIITSSGKVKDVLDTLCVSIKDQIKPII